MWLRPYQLCHVRHPTTVSRPAPQATIWGELNGFSTLYGCFFEDYVRKGSLTLTTGASLAAWQVDACGVMDDETVMEPRDPNAGLTTAESPDVTTQVRQLQNLVVEQNQRESATQKLAALKTLQCGGGQHEITGYVHEPDNAMGLVKGLPLDVPDEELKTVITLEDRELLSAAIPKRALLGRSATNIQPYRTKAVQCATCFTIGDRADVCPNVRDFVRCEQCGLQFPPD
ncbi:hypothetical protein HPB49_009737 [Dermacentor silvarum]|uniref:Uncharacterized protein n=1 Tax=Dermacentor silvarum TaxID=543639 RepID=A0ACB8CX13_DERSI|nr:hypothetical protein HPB49_009737 [Dermacentor silvarum]